MNKEIYRIHFLTMVLSATNTESEIEDYFTVFERIEIHQERAYLLNQSNEFPSIREFRISEKLEEKITTLLKTIHHDSN